jgi:hypothetical protein
LADFFVPIPFGQIQETSLLPHVSDSSVVKSATRRSSFARKLGYPTP